MTERGSAASGEAGGVSNLLEACSPGSLPSRNTSQTFCIQPHVTGDEGDDGPIVDHEDQRLHDRRHRAADRTGRVFSSLGAFRKMAHVGLEVHRREQSPAGAG